MDAYALNADGSARDPTAFQAALRQDSVKLEQLQQDPELEATLLGEDTDKMQQLLRSVFEDELQRRKNRSRFMAERTIDAQRASATVPRDTVQLYQQLHASGLQYGPAFRLLRNVHVPDVFQGLSTYLQSSSGLHGQPRTTRTKGLYMFGGVGVGKTMLMDLFVAAAPPEFQLKRVHFHDFMLDVHERLREHSGQGDPLKRVADDIATEVKMLALDELFVTDVADAMILHRLFGRLWDEGLVLVATSNRAPDGLYEGGLQRALFLPFIERLKAQCVIHDMASTLDYRRLASHTRGLYFVGPDSSQELQERFAALSEGAPAGKASVRVAMGRQLEVPAAAGACCMFDFEELCGRPVAAADYIALCDAFTTIALQGVPVFSGANRSQAYRFMTLVDVMYEHRVRFVCSAAAPPFELFESILTQQDARKADARLVANNDIVVDDNLGFTKDRTISRLTEMQSLEYQISFAEKHAPQLKLALQEAAGGGSKRRSSSS